MSPGTPVYPDTYRDLSTESLLTVFAAAPHRFRRAVADLGADELTARPRAGKWSIQENAIHVADSEVVGAARVRMVRAEPGASLPFYAQDVWAREFAYNQAPASSLEDALRLFEALRASTLPIFRSAAEADWNKSGLHAELGPITLRQLLELYADHGEWHLWRILQLREMLGRPLDMPLLLERRLFAVTP